MGLDDLNALDEQIAARELLRCCGSERWARRMAAARPFADEATMVSAADRQWAALEPADWLEAFAAHPRIGEQVGARPESARPGGDSQTAWAAQEQAAAASPGEALKTRLAERNREYETRFGYIFIVCATGKRAEEMLAMIERRLHNDPAAELAVAGEEQRRITRIRLAKLLHA